MPSRPTANKAAGKEDAMSSKANRIIAVLLIVSVLPMLNGCFDRRELDTLGVVMGIALDRTDEGQTQVTIQIANPTGNKPAEKSGSKTEIKGDSGASKEYRNISNKGDAINAIIRNMQYKTSRKLYMAHSQNIVFGEDLARDGVADSLDFFVRAPEARMTSFIFVAKGSARDIYELPPQVESMPCVELTKILQDQKGTSNAPIVTEFEFVSAIVSKTTSAVAPIVEIIEDDESKQHIYVRGTAVFKESVMVGELDATQTRGMLYVQNKANEGVMELVIEDALVTMEIRDAKSHFTPVLYEDGAVVVQLEVRVTVGVGDQTGTFNVADPDHMPLLLNASEMAIRQEIGEAIDTAQSLRADVFGIGDALNRLYPKQWEEMKSNWDELFPKVRFDIKTHVKADGNGRLVRPLVPEETTG